MSSRLQMYPRQAVPATVALPSGYMLHSSTKYGPIVSMEHGFLRDRQGLIKKFRGVEHVKSYCWEHAARKLSSDQTLPAGW